MAFIFTGEFTAKSESDDAGATAPAGRHALSTSAIIASRATSRSCRITTSRLRSTEDLRRRASSLAGSATRTFSHSLSAPSSSRWARFETHSRFFVDDGRWRSRRLLLLVLREHDDTKSKQDDKACGYAEDPAPRDMHDARDALVDKRNEISARDKKLALVFSDDSVSRKTGSGVAARRPARRCTRSRADRRARLQAIRVTTREL